MRSRNIAWILGTALAFGVGCSEDKEESAPPPATPTITELVTEVCSLMFGCCDRGEMNVLLAPWLTPDNCVDRLVSWSTLTPGGTWDLEQVTGTPVELQFRNLGALERATSERRGKVNEPGVLECQQFLRTLRKVGYKGTLAIEREAGDDRFGDIAHAVEILAGFGKM